MKKQKRDMRVGDEIVVFSPSGTPLRCDVVVSERTTPLGPLMITGGGESWFPGGAHWMAGGNQQYAMPKDSCTPRQQDIARMADTVRESLCMIDQRVRTGQITGKWLSHLDDTLDQFTRTYKG
jgi:hypothetical protein